ncbi:MAG: serine O-acetyltransferase [Thiotrichaceae bacterium]
MEKLENTTIPSNSERIGFFQQVREDIACVFERDPAARTTFEVITTYPGVHAIVSHRISHKLWINNWKYFARLFAFLSRVFTNIDIHFGATIGRRFFIDHGIGVVIGETAIVGDDVTLYHGVTLGGTSWKKGRRHPCLGNGVLVGAGAKILGPITLGNNVRVGANSVVIKDAPAESTVIGIPGKVVQTKKDSEHLAHGIDLNHHLIPDPVGRAMACMLERISLLEREIARLRPHNKQEQDDSNDVIIELKDIPVVSSKGKKSPFKSPRNEEDCCGVCDALDTCVCDDQKPKNSN